MKSIKNVFALCLMVFFSINMASAQKGDKNVSPEDRAQKQTERMTKELSLSASQTAQIEAINLEYANKRTALKTDSAEKKGGNPAMKDLKTNQMDAIKAVLTPEQLTKFEANKGKRGKGKGMKGERNPENRAADRTAKMTEELGLSAAQAQQVGDINLSYGQKMKSIKDNNTDKEAAKKAVKSLKKEKSAAIEALLTPAQLATYNEMKKAKKEKKGDKKTQRS